MPTLAKKKMTFILLSIILATALVTAYYFMSNRFSSNSADMIKEIVKSSANLSLDKIHQSSTKNGIKEWTLDADTADYFKESQEVHFKNISITYFSENHGEVVLTSTQGILNTDTNDLTAIGNVFVKNRLGNIKTEALHYRYKQRIIESDVFVTLFNKESQITANSMIMDLSSGKTTLTGNVEGYFSETLKNE